jgi:hypothetical protein
MKKKFVLFSAAAVVIAGGLIYILGVYPPASTKDTQGAIGQREVYRDARAHDAAVTPGSAPVAASTLTPAQTKRIQEISSQIATAFVLAFKDGFNNTIQPQLTALLANSNVTPGAQAVLASDLTQDVSASFVVAIQQQLVSAIQAELIQAVTAGGLNWNVTPDKQQQIITQIANSAATSFNGNVTGEISQAIYDQFVSIYAGQINQVNQVSQVNQANQFNQWAQNIANLVAPNFANQFGASLAQSLTSLYSSGINSLYSSGISN